MPSSCPEKFLLACFFHTFACGFFSYICMRVFFIHLYAGFCHTFVWDFVCVFVIHLYEYLYACFCHTFVCVFFFIHLYAILYACFCHTFVCVFFFIHLYAGFCHTFVCDFVCSFVIHLYAILYSCFCHTLVFGLAVAQWWVWSSNNQRVGGTIPTHCSTKGLVGRQLEAWQFTSLSRLRFPWARHPILPGRCNWLSATPVYF